MNIFISYDDEVRMNSKISNAFIPMSTFTEAETILIGRCPKEKFEYIEENIEIMLEHELMHMVLYKIGENKASVKYDNIFPVDTDLREWMNAG